jgi:copper homeostasis protein
MLEIACFNSASAINAFKSGANRIELCDGASVGGTSPTLKSLEEVLAAKVNIPIHVMVRPRGGDFVYSDEELEEMRASIKLFKPLVNGFVFGILNTENRIDMERNQEFVALAAPRPCTFHRAIDEVEDLILAVDDIIQCGFHSILTSGGKPDAISGRLKIAAIVERAKGNINIIAGGGVRASNIDNLKENANADWYHSSALVDGSGISSPEEIERLAELLRATPR